MRSDGWWVEMRCERRRQRWRREGWIEGKSGRTLSIVWRQRQGRMRREKDGRWQDERRRWGDEGRLLRLSRLSAGQWLPAMEVNDSRAEMKVSWWSEDVE